MTADEYDVIVLGGGPVGENVADRVVRGGLSAVIVERELVGGDCSYWACTPSKAMLRPGAALRAAAAVEGAKQAVSGALDVPAVLARRDAAVAGWSDAGQVRWLDSAGIALVRGSGRLIGEREVEVTDASGSTRRLAARAAVVIATGSEAVLPEIDGLDASAPWTSRDATAVETVPTSLAIIGGGVVAAEMATAFADLGSAVTVLARGGLLTSFEPFAGELVADALRERSVELRLHAATTAIARTSAGVTVTLGDGATVRADEVLVATGRRPRLHDLGVEPLGLDPAETIATDESLRVAGVDWLYIVGDANRRAPLTHQGKYQARAAGDAIVARAKGHAVDDRAWGWHAATADHGSVPQVVFSDPQVAAVGATLASALERGIDAASADVGFDSVSGASQHRDDYRGRARLVIDRKTETVVGATFVGPDVAELVHAATIAIVGQVPLERLWHAVPVFPTMSEIWLRLLEQYGRKDA